MDNFVVNWLGRPYFFTALIVRVFQVMGKWILPLHQGFLKVGQKRPFSVMLLCEAQIHKHEEGHDGV
jgi:hypothetical protein